MKTLIIDLSHPSKCLIGFAGDAHPFYAENSYIDRSVEWNRLHLGTTQFLNHIFLNLARVKPKSTRVLIIESLFTSKSFRDCLYSTLIVDFQVASISFQPNLSLIALSTGKSCGLLVLIDEQQTEIAIYSHNYLVLNSVTVACGLNSALSELKHLITKKTGVELGNLDNIALDLLAHAIRHETLSSEVLKSFGVSSAQFEITSDELSFCWSALLHGCGETQDYDDNGIVKAIVLSLLKLSVDDLSGILENIVFTGTGALLPGNGHLTILGNLFVYSHDL
jgi:hypothetical protein